MSESSKLLFYFFTVTVWSQGCIEKSSLLVSITFRWKPLFRVFLQEPFQKILLKGIQEIEISRVFNIEVRVAYLFDRLQYRLELKGQRSAYELVENHTRWPNIN